MHKSYQVADHFVIISLGIGQNVPSSRAEGRVVDYQNCFELLALSCGRGAVTLWCI